MKMFHWLIMALCCIIFIASIWLKVLNYNECREYGLSKLYCATSR